MNIRTVQHLQAVAVLNVTRHVGADCPLHDACALLAAGGSVVAEGVLLAHGARLIVRSSDVRRADAVAVFLVAARGGRALALLAVGEAEEAGLAAGALPADHVGFARALAAHLVAGVTFGALLVAVAAQGAAVKGRADRDDEVTTFA